MTLVRWTPRRSLLDFNSDFDHIFDNFLGTSRDIDISPRVDVEENDNEFVVSAELPGIKKDEIKVNFQDGIMTISGEKKFENEEKRKNFHRIERSYGKFSRSLEFTSNVVADKISADYKDGILSITLPKSEEAKPKLIDVKIK